MRGVLAVLFFIIGHVAAPDSVVINIEPSESEPAVTTGSATPELVTQTENVAQETETVTESENDPLSAMATPTLPDIQDDSTEVPSRVLEPSSVEATTEPGATSEPVHTVTETVTQSVAVDQPETHTDVTGDSVDKITKEEDNSDDAVPNSEQVLGAQPPEGIELDTKLTGDGVPDGQQENLSVELSTSQDGVDTKSAGTQDLPGVSGQPEPGDVEEQTPEPTVGTGATAAKEDSELTFNEWTKKVLAKEEKDKHEAQTDAAPSTVTKTKTTKKKNYASSECGAKILGNNPEATNSKSILNGNKDDYMINPCKVKKWFVVELCEPIQARSIDVASLELFSSQLKSFKVFVSDRYPSKDWRSAGEFEPTEERVVQGFPLTDVTDYFAKFVRVELIDHFGEEHFCPLTLFRMFGAVVDYEISNDDDDDDEDQPPEDEDSPTVENRNLFTSAKDTVINIVKNVLNVKDDTEEEPQQKQDESSRNETTTENEIPPDGKASTDVDASVETANDVEVPTAKTNVDEASAVTASDSIDPTPSSTTSETSSLPGSEFLNDSQRCVDDGTANDTGNQNQPLGPVEDIQPSQTHMGQTQYVSIVTKIDDNEQVETGSEPVVTLVGMGTVLSPLLQLANCMSCDHHCVGQNQTGQKQTPAVSSFCQFIQVLFHGQVEQTCSGISVIKSQSGTDELRTSQSLFQSEPTVLHSEKTKMEEIHATQSTKSSDSSEAWRSSEEQSKSKPSSHERESKVVESSQPVAPTTQTSMPVQISATKPAHPASMTSTSQSHRTTDVGSIQPAGQPDTSMQMTVTPTVSAFIDEAPVVDSVASEIQPSSSSITSSEREVTLSPSSGEATPVLPVSGGWSTDSSDAASSHSSIVTHTEKELEETTLVYETEPAPVTVTTTSTHDPSVAVEPSSVQVADKSSTANEVTEKLDSQTVQTSESTTTTNMDGKTTTTTAKQQPPPTTTTNMEDKTTAGKQSSQTTTTTPQPTTTTTEEKPRKDLGLVRVPLAQSSRESAIMRLSNRMKVLEQNVSLSSRFLEELSQRYKKQSEEMMRTLNRTVAKLTNVTMAAETKDKQHEDQMSVMESRLENLTALVIRLNLSLNTLNKQVTDRQMIWTSIEIIVIIIIFLMVNRRSKTPALSPESVKLIESMPTRMAPSTPHRRNSLSGPATPSKKTAGFEKSGPLTHKFGSDTILANADCPIIQPVTPLLALKIQPKEGNKKKKKKKHKNLESRFSGCTKGDNFSLLISDRIGNSYRQTGADINSAGLLFSNDYDASCEASPYGSPLPVKERSERSNSLKSGSSSGTSTSSTSQNPVCDVCKGLVGAKGLEPTQPGDKYPPSQSRGPSSPKVQTKRDKLSPTGDKNMEMVKNTKSHKRQKSLPQMYIESQNVLTNLDIQPEVRNGVSHIIDVSGNSNGKQSVMKKSESYPMSAKGNDVASHGTSRPAYTLHKTAGEEDPGPFGASNVGLKWKTSVSNRKVDDMRPAIDYTTRQNKNYSATFAIGGSKIKSSKGANYQPSIGGTDSKRLWVANCENGQRLAGRCDGHLPHNGMNGDVHDTSNGNGIADMNGDHNGVNTQPKTGWRKFGGIFR